MSLRLFWRRFHLWIGVATGLFLLGISLSGIVLMFEDKVNKLMRPDLFAVSGPAMTQTADVYFDKAREAVPNGEAYQLRYPQEEGHPAIVMMRLRDSRGSRGEGNRGEGARREGTRTEGARTESASGEGRRGEAARTETNADAALNNAPAADQGSEQRNAEHAAGERERGPREQRRGDGERRGMGGGNGTGGGSGMGAGAGGMNGGGMARGEGGRPRVLAVYMDPATARVLGTADPRSSVVGWALALHANLFLQPYGGRQIVGWIGCGLFILCLSGFYLWWPRGGSFLRGLRWWRGPTLPINLHHRVGFWIVVPLGVMAFTGFIQGFPQQSRAVTGALLPMTAQPPRGGAGNGTVTPALSPQHVLDLAVAGAAGFHPTLLALPQEAGKPWRVMLENAAGDHKTLFVDDAKAGVSQPPAALQGDSVLAFLRRIHEGSHDGPVWETIVFLTALTPPLFFVTGVMMWLRRRKNTKALALRTKGHQTNVAAAAGAE